MSFEVAQRRRLIPLVRGREFKFEGVRRPPEARNLTFRLIDRLALLGLKSEHEAAKFERSAAGTCDDTQDTELNMLAALIVLIGTRTTLKREVLGAGVLGSRKGTSTSGRCCPPGCPFSLDAELSVAYPVCTSILRLVLSAFSTKPISREASAPMTWGRWSVCAVVVEARDSTRYAACALGEGRLTLRC